MKHIEAPVVVVGAGPSGSAAAYHLVRHGVDVLLIDKDDFPRDKICGDCCGSEATESLWTEFKIAATATNGFYPITTALMVSPGGGRYRAAFRPGVVMTTVKRAALDHLIYGRAIDAGAHFRRGRVVDIALKGGRVCGVVLDNKETVSASVVIGADGANSVLARRLQPRMQPDPGHRAVALRMYARGIATEPGVAEYHFRRELLPGYAWIFPMADGWVNIGCGATMDMIRAQRINLRAMMERFLGLPEIATRCTREFSAQPQRAWPLNSPTQPGLGRTFDGALLVGDAGGFLSPLTGEGIRFALESGKEAARCVAEALRGGGPSRESLGAFDKWYERVYRAKFTTEYRQQRFINRHFGVLNAVVGVASLSRTLARKLVICGWNM